MKYGWPWVAILLQENELIHPTKNNLNVITLFSVWFGKEIYSASWSNITKPCTSRFSGAGSQWDKTSCKDLIIVILLDHVTDGKNVIPFPSCAQYYCCIVKLTITGSPCCLSKNSIIVASFKHKATIQVLQKNFIRLGGSYKSYLWKMYQKHIPGHGALVPF